MFRQTFTLTVETGIGVSPDQVARAVLFDLLNKGYVVGVTKVETEEIYEKPLERKETIVKTVNGT